MTTQPSLGRGPAPSPWAPTPMRIARVRREMEGVFTFSFDVPSGFIFRPGQFNMLYAHGIGEVPISISGDPAAPYELVHTIRAVGTVTRALEALGTGDVLGVRGPYGSAWPVENARGKDVLFVAGGLGLAPLRPAILHVLRNRADYGRVTILYGARSPADLLYRDELERWRGRFDCRLEAIVDRAGRDWFGNVGVVTKLVADVPVEPDDTIFVCGPEIMMRFVVRELEQRGVPRSAIWLSMERSMKCGVGLCGHCQYGGTFVCREGPVYRFDRVAPLFFTREV
jgi:NAD(P)H-flavin reductase